MESLLKSFTGKIKNMGNHDYWTHLKLLKMLSISRRFERYRIIYCFKIIKGLTPNCNLNWNCSEKYGQLLDYSEYEHSIRRQSFHLMAPRLFNSIPVYLRLLNDDITFDTWKVKLDKFLEIIRDNPVTGPNQSGLCEY